MRFERSEGAQGRASKRRSSKNPAARALRVSVLAAGMLLTDHRRAAGFSFPEHANISNAAVKLDERDVRTVLGSTDGSISLLVNSLVAPALKDSKVPQSPSYGALVAMVDDQMTDGDFFAVFEMCHDQPGLLRCAWSHLVRDHRDTQWYLRATHFENNHFGEDDVATAALWHRIAISEAARSGEAGESNHLLLALAANAVADHHLEDFFCPGHTATAKRGVDDLVVKAGHNRLNRRGRKFFPARLEILRQVLADATCFSHSDVGQFWQAAGGEDGIRCYGDGYLDKSDAKAEFVLVSAVTAVSVRDVIRSYVERTPVNDLWPNEYARSTAIETDTSTEQSCVSFGCLKGGDADRRTPGVKFSLTGPVPWDLHVGYGFSQLSVGAPSGWEGGAEVMLFHYEKGTSAHTVPLLPRLALFAGAEAGRRGPESEVGLSLRALYSFPKLDAHISLEGGQRWYLGSERAQHRTGTIRLEHGFGLLYVGFGIGLESVPVGPNRKSETGPLLSAVMRFYDPHLLFTEGR